MNPSESEDDLSPQDALPSTNAPADMMTRDNADGPRIHPSLPPYHPPPSFPGLQESREILSIPEETPLSIPSPILTKCSKAGPPAYQDIFPSKEGEDSLVLLRRQTVPVLHGRPHDFPSRFSSYRNRTGSNSVVYQSELGVQQFNRGRESLSPAGGSHLSIVSIRGEGFRKDPRETECWKCRKVVKTIPIRMKTRQAENISLITCLIWCVY